MSRKINVDFENISIGQRIRLLRREKALSQLAFAERINRSSSIISKIEKGSMELSPLISRAICEIFRVMKQWLYTGEGPMYWPEEKQTEDQVTLAKVSEAAIMYKALYRIFAEGDKTKIGMVRAQLDALDPGEKKEG